MIHNSSVPDDLYNKCCGLINGECETGRKSRALVRQVPHSFTDALAKFFGSGPQDIELAQSQHHNYVKALEDAGVEVTVMEADNAHPDCVFVEDQAVVIDGHVLLPVPGHETPRGTTPYCRIFD